MGLEWQGEISNNERKQDKSQCLAILKLPKKPIGPRLS
jgi:hypothetical protein